MSKPKITSVTVIDLDEYSDESEQVLMLLKDHLRHAPLIKERRDSTFVEMSCKMHYKFAEIDVLANEIGKDIWQLLGRYVEISVDNGETYTTSPHHKLS